MCDSNPMCLLCGIVLDMQGYFWYGPDLFCERTISRGIVKEEYLYPWHMKYAKGVYSFFVFSVSVCL